MVEAPSITQRTGVDDDRNSDSEEPQRHAVPFETNTKNDPFTAFALSAMKQFYDGNSPKAGDRHLASPGLKSLKQKPKLPGSSRRLKQRKLKKVAAKPGRSSQFPKSPVRTIEAPIPDDRQHAPSLSATVGPTGFRSARYMTVVVVVWMHAEY